MAKRKGWDSEEHNRARKSGALKVEADDVRDYRKSQRQPYDPAKEHVVDTVGQIDADKHGKAQIFVEITSYDNTGPWRVQMLKRGTDRDGRTFATPNLGRMFPAEALELAKLVERAATKAAEHNAPGLAKLAGRAGRSAA